MIALKRQAYGLRKAALGFNARWKVDKMTVRMLQVGNVAIRKSYECEEGCPLMNAMVDQEKLRLM